MASSRTSKSKAGSKTETAGVKPPATKSAQIEHLEAENADSALVHHKVKAGETLYSIATLYKTTVAALKRDNGNIAVLHPGMILIVQPSR